jgi:hypothetical protein
MRLPALTLLLVCLAAQGCILFTSPVNSPPIVKIVPPNGPVFRGQTIELSAEVSDPNGAGVNLEWTTSMGPCPVPLDVSQRPTTMPVGASDANPTFSFALQPGGPATVCVWVLATDPQGATTVDALSISSQNRPPVAAIEVLAPSTKTAGGLFELYSIFHLSAAKSHDPDGDAIVDPQFELVGSPPAAMPTPKLMPCPGAMPNVFLTCLDVGSFAGTYTIALSVSDGFTRSATTTATLTVDADHPACVSGTDPPLDASPVVLDPSEAKTFTVEQILDDGAPLPTPADGAHVAPSFAWQVRRNAGAWQPIVGYDHINAFTLPQNTYATGDVVDVSVTISDGVATHLQPACDPGCPVGCPQSAQWTVEYR